MESPPRPSRICSLRDLLDPLPIQTFFAEAFEARALRVTRQDSGHFSELLTRDDIDRILTTLDLRHPVISMSRAGDVVDPVVFSREDGSMDVASLLRLHSEGATIILNQLQDVHPPLADLCDGLGIEFSAPVQTNTYVTPSRADGFQAHFDTHDVFVLQVEGSKHWRLYDSPVELPLAAQSAEIEAEQLGAPSEVFDLQAGDTLYLPRGLVHEAVSNDQTSVHVTVGVLGYTWTELVYEAVATIVLDNPDFRRTLPPGFADPAFESETARGTFRDLIQRVVAQADFDAALETVRREFIASRKPNLRGQFTQLAALTELSPDSVIVRRDHLVFALRDDQSALIIVFDGKEISIPRLGAEAVRFALASHRFQVAELPGQLDEESKLTLVRRLVREGLLKVMSSADVS